MNLELESGRVLEDVTEDQIPAALQDEVFAILSVEEYTFMQCHVSGTNEYILNWQEGSLDRHYSAVDEPITLERVIAALCKYLRGDDSWRSDFVWQKEDLDMIPHAIPEYRSYVHAACESETTVTKETFQMVSNPLSGIARTWCMGCEAHFPVSEFHWLDTGENISDYYSRYTANATGKQLFLTSRAFLIILWTFGIAVGAIGTYLLFSNQAMWLRIVLMGVGAIVGAIVASVVYFQGVHRRITKKVCGVSDTRLLS